ncbi:MAG: hemolysin family protein [Bryobacteraceae bacterium]
MPTFEILAIVLLAIANGVFAMSEIAVVSSRKARLQALAEEGSRKARVALELANNPNDFLSTVQIGITVISTLAGVFGGATLAGYLTASLNSVPWVSPHGESVAVGLVVVGISYLSLVVGELVPKRIGLSNPERYAAFLAPFMRVLASVASPVVRFLSWSTDVVIRLIPMKHEAQQTVTEEEIRHMIEQGTQSGTFEEAEQDMVEGVFRLGNRRVSELMTPRQDIGWIDTERSPEEMRETLRQSKYHAFLSPTET